MNIGLFQEESWFKLNQSLREKITTLDGADTYGFLGVGHALSEITESLANLYSHKMSIGIVQGCGPACSKVAVHFSRKGMNVQRQLIDQKDSLEEWGRGLSKDTLFVCLELDNPFTGEYFDFSALQKILEERKIFHILVSYNSHRFVEFKAGDYSAYVLGSCADRAIAFLGSRVKFQPYVSSFLDWNTFSLDSFLQIQESVSLKEDKVKEFEAASIQGMHPFFQNQALRLYDRSVVFWEDVDGAALRELLLKKVNRDNYRPGYDQKIETASLCRWQSANPWEWLAPSLKDPQRRGLVVFDSSLLSEEFKEHVMASVEAIYKMQSLKA